MGCEEKFNNNSIPDAEEEENRLTFAKEKNKIIEYQDDVS